MTSPMPPEHPYPGQPPPPPWAAPPGQPPQPPRRRTSGLAVAAFVLGLVGAVISWFTFGIPSILATVFGGVALRQTLRDRQLDGRGMAIAGLALGLPVAIAAWVVWAAFWGGLGNAVTQASRPAASSSPSDAGATGLGIPDGIQETTPPPPDVGGYTPTSKDFRIALKVKSKHCFGSAGCNVTYEPELTIVTAETLDPSTTYSITYEVRGGEDGASIDTIELTDGKYQVSEGLAQTANRSAKLTAVITDVTAR